MSVHVLNRVPEVEPLFHGLLEGFAAADESHPAGRKGPGSRPLTGNWPKVDEPISAKEKIIYYEGTVELCGTSRVSLRESVLSSQCQGRSVLDRQLSPPRS